MPEILSQGAPGYKNHDINVINQRQGPDRPAALVLFQIEIGNFNLDFIADISTQLLGIGPIPRYPVPARNMQGHLRRLARHRTGDLLTGPPRRTFKVGIPGAMKQGHAHIKRLKFLVGEHQRRQIKSGAQNIPDTRLNLDRRVPSPLHAPNAESG